MTLRIEASMVKNNMENVVARAQSDEDQHRADLRHSPAAHSRRVAAPTTDFGTSMGPSPRRKGDEALEEGGVTLCAPRKDRPGVDFGDAIGKELQNLYDDLVAQPVPDRFLNLLNQLEKNMVSSGLSSSAPGERE
jgi:hypothetical protein